MDDLLQIVWKVMEFHFEIQMKFQHYTIFKQITKVFTLKIKKKKFENLPRN